MTQRFITAFTTIILTNLIAACTDSGGNLGAKTVQNIVGQWKSESVTRQQTITAKFSGDGTCYFRESGGEQLACNWSGPGPGNGQTKIAITFPGKSDVSFASPVGDRLFVNEPARETLFVREESQLLDPLRQLLSGGDQSIKR